MRLRINRTAAPRTGYSHGSRKGRVDDLLFRMIDSALDLVVVEWEFAGQRAIQSGLAEGRPYVFLHGRALIVLADSRYPRVYFLQSCVALYELSFQRYTYRYILQWTVRQVLSTALPLQFSPGLLLAGIK